MKCYKCKKEVKEPTDMCLATLTCWDCRNKQLNSLNKEEELLSLLKEIYEDYKIGIEMFNDQGEIYYNQKLFDKIKSYLNKAAQSN